MKKVFWNVEIDIYEGGTVDAAVIRSREAVVQPSDGYRREPRREVYSLWFRTKYEANGAVVEALAMNREQEAAA